MSFLDIFKSKNSDSGSFKETYILALVHKLRTPLSGARWGLDMALKNKECKDRDVLNESYNKIIEALNTIGEILKAAEMNSMGRFANLRKEKINMCVVIEEILKNLDYLVKEKNINIQYDRECDPLTTFGDKKLLDLGLTNIFDNAFRYSPNGTVTVTMSEEGNMAKMVIQDNGIGIERDDLKHMFEQFYRGKNAKELDQTQNGLGLFATRKIIEMHKGSIKIESELNKGTTVTIKLPVD
jgi:signal transduction histidine kinase